MGIYSIVFDTLVVPVLSYRRSNELEVLKAIHSMNQ